VAQQFTHTVVLVVVVGTFLKKAQPSVLSGMVQAADLVMHSVVYGALE